MIIRGIRSLARLEPTLARVCLLRFVWLFLLIYINPFTILLSRGYA